MKTLKTTVLAFVAVLSLGTMQAQEESPFSVGADLVSSYVWRGVKYSGPAVQPGVEFGVGGLSIGAWGSFGISDMGSNNAVNESDFYAGYEFDFGLSVGFCDYFYQGVSYFDEDNHAMEANLGYGIGSLSLSANYIFSGGTLTDECMYFELGYAFSTFDVFVGMGDGWHTSDTDFNVCNVGIGTSKEVKITDSFSLPIFGQVIVNPEKEDFNIVVGISF